MRLFLGGEQYELGNQAAIYIRVQNYATLRGGGRGGEGEEGEGGVCCLDGLHMQRGPFF